MAAPANIIDHEAVNTALSAEFIANFKQENDRLLELISAGAYAVETMPANTQLYQLKVTGALNDSKTDESSSGSAYVEGDLVALSKYQTEKVPLGTVDIEPYRKMTSGKAILAGGYEQAVLRTDAKMAQHLRSKAIKRYFDFLANGTSTATGTGLQAALAYSDAALEDKMEELGDEFDSAVHFVNRQDAAAYLATAPVTIQNLYGMTYLESFLGVTGVFLSSKVPSGTMFTTCKENVRVFGLDFAELSRADLAYETDAQGLIGVYHEGVRNRVSTETGAVLGMTIMPEVTDYIVKGTIAPTA